MQWDLIFSNADLFARFMKVLALVGSAVTLVLHLGMGHWPILLGLLCGGVIAALLLTGRGRSGLPRPGFRPSHDGPRR